MASRQKWQSAEPFSALTGGSDFLAPDLDWRVRFLSALETGADFSVPAGRFFQTLEKVPQEELWCGLDDWSVTVPLSLVPPSNFLYICVII